MHVIQFYTLLYVNLITLGIKFLQFWLKLQKKAQFGRNVSFTIVKYLLVIEKRNVFVEISFSVL